MKKSIFFLAFFLTFFFNTYIHAQLYIDQEEKGKAGIGFQVCYPFYGASLMVNINESFSIQGILGINQNLRSYSGRLLYNFTHSSESRSYAYGLLGSFSYTGYLISDFLRLEKKTETIFGYGFGLGVEYSRQKSMPELPLWLNFELGYGRLNFKDVDFNSSAIMVGVGIHYYFGE